MAVEVEVEAEEIITSNKIMTKEVINQTNSSKTFLLRRHLMVTGMVDLISTSSMIDTHRTTSNKTFQLHRRLMVIFTVVAAEGEEIIGEEEALLDEGLHLVEDMEEEDEEEVTGDHAIK
mmetsp:Transcript_4880/g.7408  ORF Transcript_4880/g.7408 Transcript_4880/m.7408 type:complete len:119 (-) Transcript_4880:80-436(-)